MRAFHFVMIAAALASGSSVMAGDVVPGDTLRAAYLGTNPAQATRDAATGEVRGPAYDLARELALRNNVRLEFKPIDGSPIKAVADIDRAGQKIAGTVNDSITLCMKRILKQATIVELENNPAELSKALTARTIDALGANRQRLTTLSAATPGTRLLPDDLFNVPQNIVVPKG